jgi:hypothetical protein
MNHRNDRLLTECTPLFKGVASFPSLKSCVMKNVMAYIVTALMLTAFTPIQAKAESKLKSHSVSTAKNAQVELDALISRLEEIEAMDKSNMSRLERVGIRKELRSIEKEVALHSSESVYISGALFTVVIALFLFLSLPDKEQPLNADD